MTPTSTPSTPSLSTFANTLRASGHAVIIFTPFELGDVSQQHVEEQLFNAGYELIDKLTDDKNDDEPELCEACDGTGEGQYDGTRCGRCHGKGVIKENDSDDY